MEQHDVAWEMFDEYIARTRERVGDRYVPIALICLEAIANDDGSTDVLPEQDGLVVWPASFPIPERGPLLARLSTPYRDGTVLRDPRT